MNTVMRFIAVGALAVVPVLVLAHGSEGPASGHGPGMMMNPEQMEQMHQNWSRMDEMMQQIPNSSADERQRLMEEHWKAMEEQMGLMHEGMMGPGMMGQSGHGMMHGNQGQGMMQGQPESGKQSKGANQPSVDQRMRMMEERMNQMQLMMEQMFRRQQQMHQN
ncbi:DUF4175 domain-containing protein [Marinobacter sp. F4216]|uniref:DUF4175 domain-containing protein n=1 Tax=Marinobacter sp. F4216 TaxID=2874281 RepID=UPI001CBF55DD|nr:DUF4175 domain-containing protein [Marinobacter sp. F4216]MBZ2168867.1 DUF4175 domain-containing protein [Marinobacter sp. F4216]